jgi:hypothetical protein
MRWVGYLFLTETLYQLQGTLLRTDLFLWLKEQQDFKPVTMDCKIRSVYSRR